jgi:diguanylate cyclase (GGDEF)-like protein
MRLATITNWAYGATVALTLASGTTMILASNAQEKEQAAVERRYALDQATSKLASEIYALTGYVRQFAITGDQSYASLYASEQKALGSVERRIAGVRDLGAEADELNALKEGIHWANALHDEQRIAIAARQSGDAARAQQIIFGPEYERELNRAEGLIERFQYRLDQRTETDVVAARSLAQIWRRTSEIVLGLTGLLFLCVLFFVFRRRVLHPVVRLSDVIGRLAAQDYAAEPPEFDQIDEIGDMAQALRVFRENGIERQRLEKERDVDRMIRDLLSRMTQRMQGCEAMAELRAVVERFMPEIAPGYAGSLYLLDPVRRIMVEASEWHSPTHSKSEFSPLSCWALGRGTLHRPAGHYIDVPCDHLLTTADDPIDTICLPLVAQRETLGLIYLEALSDTEAAQSAPSEIYLKMLAENVGLAIANLQLRDALRDLAMTDALTGLANRRRLDAVVESLLAEAISQRAPISCIMLDVDHFKHFNDEFGHEAGDTVLREVGAVLKASSRNGTTAFRYGGEEFALFIPGIPADEVVRRAEEIRARIAALHVRGEGRDLGPITVSLGVASAPEQVTPDKLLQTADAALRRAKQTGRNRVVTAVSRSATVG